MHVENTDAGHWLMKVKAYTSEGQQCKGRLKFIWLDGVKRALAVRKVGMEEETQLARERSVWREFVRA